MHLSQPLYGLLLAGGQSRRMGHDKALLSYDGRSTQLEHSTQLLQAVCHRVFISQRAEQCFSLPNGSTAIDDAIDTIGGPLCGILSAMQAHPEAHWLILACDLPRVRNATLTTLIRHFRERPPQFTAYRSSSDGLPEPLCAITGRNRPQLRELAQPDSLSANY